MKSEAMKTFHTGGLETRSIPATTTTTYQQVILRAGVATMEEWAELGVVSILTLTATQTSMGAGRFLEQLSFVG
jgi:hypothetical protein